MEYEPWWRTIADGLARGIVIGLIVAVVLVLGFFAATWAYHDWWVSTHCTMVLGTQVCK